MRYNHTNTTMKCKKCGEYINYNMKFCGYCGEPMPEHTNYITEEIARMVDSKFDININVGDKVVTISNLEYDTKSNMISVMDSNNDVVFSTKCDQPEAEFNDHGEITVINTFYYFKETPQYFIAKHNTWSIFDIVKNDVCLIDSPNYENQRITAEFDELEIDNSSINFSTSLYSSRLIKCKKNNKYGLIKLEGISKSNITILGDFIFDEIRKINQFNNSIIEDQKDDSSLWLGIVESGLDVLISGEFGPLHTTRNADNIKMVHESFHNIAIIDDISYLLYSKNDLRRDLKLRVEYDSKALKPSYKLGVITSMGDCYLTTADSNRISPGLGLVYKDRIICDTIYEDIDYLDGDKVLKDLFIALKDGYYGVISIENRVVVPFKFTEMKLKKKITSDEYSNIIKIELEAKEYEKKYKIEFNTYSDHFYPHKRVVSYTIIK